MEDLAKIAAMAKAIGGTVAGLPNAAHMDTIAYGLHAARKPMQTATDIWRDTAANRIHQSCKHVFFHTSSASEPSYLDDECMRVGNLVLRRHVLLHGLAGAPDSQQDECVGEENDSAGDNIAEEEQADDVAHCRGVLAGSVPVDATGCAIWLGPVLSPATQGSDGENAGVAPDPCDQHVSVGIRKLVTCGRELQIRAKIKTMSICQSGYTQCL